MILKNVYYNQNLALIEEIVCKYLEKGDITHYTFYTPARQHRQEAASPSVRHTDRMMATDNTEFTSNIRESPDAWLLPGLFILMLKPFSVLAG